jgi:hypothetical protein
LEEDRAIGKPKISNIQDGLSFYFIYKYAWRMAGSSMANLMGTLNISGRAGQLSP